MSLFSRGEISKLTSLKILAVGDGMIDSASIAAASDKLTLPHEIKSVNWLMDKVELQKARRIIERDGPSSQPVTDEILKAVSDADLVLAHYAPISADMIKCASRLKLIGICRAGYENVDVASATIRGIPVFRIMGRNSEAVSDFTIGLLLAETRNIARSHALLKQNIWIKPPEEDIHDLRGRTVGLVGFGYVGRLVAKKIKGFGVNILAYDPNVSDNEVTANFGQPASLEEIFSQSDYICIHARLSDETKGLIGRRLISLMKPTSYLINTARAEIVDESALLDALEQRKIAGAALDVFWREPLPKDHPLIRLDNVTLTSHLAGTTIESLSRSPELLIEEINALLNGETTSWVVNPEVLKNFRIN
jgi:D-3-phosphoglycerate dehydrogenase / 2-oxoglutarate reductase